MQNAVCMDIQYDTANVNQSTLINSSKHKQTHDKTQRQRLLCTWERLGCRVLASPLVTSGAWIWGDKYFSHMHTSSHSFVHHRGGLAWKQPAQHRAHGCCKSQSACPVAHCLCAGFLSFIKFHMP